MNFSQVTVSVAKNVRLARDTYLLRLPAGDMASAILPGQFLMLRLPSVDDPLLGRPFALYDTVLDDNGEACAIDIVHLVIGKMTGLFAKLQPGDKVEVWGPLGNGFPQIDPVEHVGLVAGGIGQTPFLAHIRDLLGTRQFGHRPVKRQAVLVSVYYGVRTAELAAGVDDFQAAGAEVHLATDDGSLGHHGFVTDLLAKHEKPQHLFGCGPEPMMKTLAGLAKDWDVPCHLSLETPMACGVGICFSCVAPVRTDDGWDYRRVCVDGPVFDARELVWE